MAVVGAKPKPEGTTVTRSPQQHNWTEVQNVPYAGPVPVSLPQGLERATREWWATVKRLPHAILWTDGDWRFALATVYVAERFFRGEGGVAMAAELRNREKILGLTLDARRDLRIRYVDPKPAQPEGANVTRLADYRSL